MSRNYASSSSATATSSDSVQASSLHDEAKDVQEELKAMEDVELASKKDAGTVGKKIQLSVNYYRVVIANNVTVTHFDFDIKEDLATLGKESVRKRDEKQRFFTAFMKEKYPAIAPKIAFDGMASCYFMGEKELVGSTGEGSGKVTKFQYAPRGPRKRDFTVTVRRVNQFNSNMINKYLSGHTSELAQDAIQAFDVILRHQASTTMVQGGRNFFNPEQKNAKDIGSGREVWFGYHQSLRAIEGKSGGTLALNIDTAAAAFMKQIQGAQLALEILNPRDEREIGDYRFFNDYRRKDLEKSIKGVQFRTTYAKNNERLWRCNGLTRFGADSQKFKLDDGSTCLVSDYFQKHYKIKLKFPHMPCIIVGNVKEGRAKYFPMELMMVGPRQRSPGKCDDTMTANMIRAVATPAPVRQAQTNTVAKTAIDNASKLGAAYGMKFNAQMEQVTGRVLPGPQLDYGKGKKIIPRQGQWDTRDSNFYDAKPVEKWIIINYNTRSNDNTISSFARDLVRCANAHGMKMGEASKIFHVRDSRELEAKIAQCAANKMSLAVIIMARKNTQDYSFIKSNAEINHGVMTQCIQSKNVDRCNGQLLGNLLQKINTKMGGVNTKISAENKLTIFKRPAMVVGISMTHPPKHSGNPTIVSAVFSCDASVSKYTAIHRLQKSGFTLVADIKNIMVEGLKAFYRRTTKKPEKIVIYRGGGSEGELQKIANFEIGKIKEAFAELSKGSDYRPGLTYVVVNKMHHFRNFCSNTQDQVGKSGNVPAGTVVDTNIVSKKHFDYYITASQGIQGTSRPVHYTLIHDDNDLSSDSLQMMTWHLCHGYARCTRSVSIPVPVYYAVLDAERVSRYLNDTMGSDAGSMVMGDDNQNDFKALTENITVKSAIKDMYFV